MCTHIYSLYILLSVSLSLHIYIYIYIFFYFIFYPPGREERGACFRALRGWNPVPRSYTRPLMITTTHSYTHLTITCFQQLATQASATLASRGCSFPSPNARESRKSTNSNKTHNYQAQETRHAKDNYKRKIAQRLKWNKQNTSRLCV